MSSIFMYSVTHKECAYPESNWIKQIAVGSYSKSYTGLTDSTGKNISRKNQSYNEITAQYWVRYNKPSDFVGFAHYRRYFLFNSGNFSKEAEYTATDHNIFKSLSNEGQLQQCLEIFKCSDIIVPRATYFPRGLKNHYIENQIPEETWEAFKHHASILFPECVKYIKILELSNFAHMRNMYIMPWKLYTNYIDTLIPVLDAVYAEIGGSIYEQSFKNRYPGFLSEQFFNLWLNTVALRRFEIPIVNISTL